MSRDNLEGTTDDQNPQAPPRDYQPTKAETEREYDMPGADIVTVRNAFFRRVKVREKPPEDR